VYINLKKYVLAINLSNRYSIERSPNPTHARNTNKEPIHKSIIACARRKAKDILTVQHTRDRRRLDDEVCEDADEVDVDVGDVGVEEGGCEYASQKPDRRHTCRPSDHQCWFGDTALPQSLHGGWSNGSSSGGGVRSGVAQLFPINRMSPFLK
jgi:hypothetical protein